VVLDFRVEGTTGTSFILVIRTILGLEQGLLAHMVILRANQAREITKSLSEIRQVDTKAVARNSLYMKLWIFRSITQNQTNNYSLKPHTQKD
jgi:hypothetical protein